MRKLLKGGDEMKKITVYIMVMAILLTVCNVHTKSSQAVEDMDGTEIEPLLSEKIDTSRQGVIMSFHKELSSDVTKGDDGFCYYFRTKGKGKNKKVIFYKNNGIKVCKTAMKKFAKKKYKKYKYYISSFAKYGDYFFVAFQSPYTDRTFMTTVDIETGKWGSMIKIPDSYADSAIIYDNHIYYVGKEGYIEQKGEITVYDLSGRATYLGYMTNKRGYDVQVKCIVDDKIYYCESDYNSETKIKRCSLNGKNKETLCSGDSIGVNAEIGPFYPETLKIDGDYIYALVLNYSPRGYELIRIPLYGGKVEKVAENLSCYFELSEDSVFFADDNETYIYKIDKGLTSESVPVAQPSYFLYGDYGMDSNPFRCADGHLIVRGDNEKERKTVDGILHNEYSNWSLWTDMTENYAPDWYWMSEDGEIEDVINGSGLKKKWK